MGTRTAGVYCRISEDREGTMLGVDRQREDCTRLCEQREWAVADVYVDDDVSAYSGRRRPQYERLLDDLREGRIDAVVAWHADRLHRSPRELETFIDIVDKSRAQVATVQSGDVDLGTASGRAVARTLGAWSRHEVELKAERTRRAHQQAAQQGRWRGGGRPFGFAADGVTHDPVEAEELRRLTAAVLDGEPLAALIRDLNARGVTTTTGRTWSYATLRQMLVRPRNAGLSEYRGEVVGSATWEPIVSQETWRQVVAVLSDPARRRSRSNVTKYLLPGLARCSVCGGPMRSAHVPGRDGASRVIYRCHVYRDQHDLDAYVDDLVAERLRRADAADLLTDPEPGDDTAADLAEVEQRLDELARAFAAGSVTSAQFVTASGLLRERLDGLRQAAARAARAPALAPLLMAPDPGGAYLALPLERRRAAIRALLDVVVLPAGRGFARGFDPERVQITWRTP